MKFCARARKRLKIKAFKAQQWCARSKKWSMKKNGEYNTSPQQVVEAKKTLNPDLCTRGKKVTKMRLTLLILTSIVLIATSEELIRDKVAACEPLCLHGQLEEMNKCCSDHGYSDMGAECKFAGIIMRFDVYCIKKVETIEDVRTENLRLKSTIGQLLEDLNVCKADHKKYVESMAQTKDLIERMFTERNG